MRLLNDSLARSLLRLSTACGYLSALVGVGYFGVTFLAFDKAKTDNLLVVAPRPLLGVPMLWLGLGCIAAGVLSLLCWAVVRCCAVNPSAAASTQLGIRLLCWLPMIVALVFVMRDALR